jgi:hypothetical protein
MRAAVAALATALFACVACAGATGQGPSAAAPTATTARPPAPARLTVDSLLARGPEDGLVLLRLSVARAHPLGPRIEPFVLAWPGWSATLRSITRHPVDELDWIEVVGPREPEHERLATRTVADDAVIDGRLAARSDGTLRVVVRPQSHLVLAMPADAAASQQPLLQGAVLDEPESEPDEALHVDLLRPHGAVPEVPPEVRRLRVRVFSRPGAAAEGFGTMECDDAPTAERVADRLRARVESLNGLVARLLTHDLLGGLVIETKGAAVELRLPATREQLDALATLAAGFFVAPESD